jgi:hypothetical protein
VKKLFLKNMSPGVNGNIEYSIIKVGMIFAIAFSFVTFMISYGFYSSDLYSYINGAAYANENAVMKEFYLIIKPCLNSFKIVLILMLPLMLFNCGFYLVGSKSVYLIKRLPSRFKFVKSCVAAPLMGVLLYLLCALIVVHICYLVYNNATPKTAVLPDQYRNIWIHIF